MCLPSSIAAIRMIAWVWSGVATITATLSSTTTQDVTVNLGYSGTATGGGTDYTASTTQIVIAAGSTTGNATVTAVQDTVDEPNETVIVDITDVTGATESSHPSGSCGAARRTWV